MTLHKLERRNYGRKWPVSIKYQNLHSFKEELILLCQSILKMRRIIHLHGSAHLTIPLSLFYRYYLGRYLNWVNWFHFLNIEGGLLVILIDCMNFMAPFLDVMSISLSTVLFLTQLNSGVICQ